MCPRSTSPVWTANASFSRRQILRDQQVNEGLLAADQTTHLSERGPRVSRQPSLCDVWGNVGRMISAVEFSWWCARFSKVRKSHANHQACLEKQSRSWRDGGLIMYGRQTSLMSIGDALATDSPKAASDAIRSCGRRGMGQLGARCRGWSAMRAKLLHAPTWMGSRDGPALIPAPLG